MPTVSVIIATYNWAPVLPYAIQSVLDQEFADFELLVIGDRCTDESEHVVGAFDDPRVHWHNLDVRTKHQSGPNNEGLRRASGEVIAYLGHDDLWLPNHLRLLVGAIKGEIGFVYGKTLAVGPYGRPTVLPDALFEAAGRPPPLGDSPFALLPPTAVAHRSSLARDVGRWREPSQTGFDVPQVDLWTRMAARGGAPVLVPRVTNIKIDASRRRHVYLNRPSHEQAYWLQRIRTSADPEAAMLAACTTDYVYASAADRARTASFDTLDVELFGKQRLRRFLARLRNRSRPRRPAADVLLRLRRYKGLVD